MRQLHELLERLGTSGVLGLGVLLFCLPFYLTAVEPADQALEAQRATAERLKTRSPNQIIATGSDAYELQRFQALFPSAERLTDELESLYTLAQNAGLELQQGEYRLEGQGQGLMTYRVTLPLRGSYTNIRQFVAAVLDGMPIASVDALRFERKKAGDALLDAQVRLTIHFQPVASSNTP